LFDAVKKNGAKCAIVQEGIKPEMLSQLRDVSIIKVADGVDALCDLATWWRTNFKIPCVGITGSNGKSTTKEMVASIASVCGDVLKTEGNYNNLIGLPLTVLRLRNNHKVAVLEMGMNAKGEISKLTSVSNPDVGVITNITAAHLEKLNSVEGVAKAKGELFENMRKDGVVIINEEDPWVKKLGSKYKGRKITFGMQNSCDIKFLNMQSIGLETTNLMVSILGKERLVKLPIPGTHNVMNAMAAIAVGVALNISIDDILKGLIEFSPMSMRFERVQLSNGVCLINDSYNANPLSMKAAFRTVGAVKRSGRFIAVLGDMLELGEQSSDLHKDVGREIVRSGADLLYTYGKRAHDIARGAIKEGLDHSSVNETEDIEELGVKIEKEIRAGDVLLVKGSRGMKMERVVEHLKHNIGCG